MKTWHWVAIAVGGYFLFKDSISPKAPPQAVPGAVIIGPPNTYILHGFDPTTTSVAIAYAPPGIETIILGTTQKIAFGKPFTVHRVEPA